MSEWKCPECGECMPWMKQMDHCMEKHGVFGYIDMKAQQKANDRWFAAHQHLIPQPPQVKQ